MIAAATMPCRTPSKVGLADSRLMSSNAVDDDRSRLWETWRRIHREQGPTAARRWWQHQRKGVLK